MGEKGKKPQQPIPEPTYRPKYTTEMDFNEFVEWSAGYVLTAFVRGETLRTAMYSVCQAMLQNEVFGPNKPKK